MDIRQISVFIENRSGQLAQVCGVLAENGIDLKALSIADTQDFGILRIIVQNTQQAMDILLRAGYTCKTTEVLAVTIDDKPGGMAKVMDVIARAGIGVEYAYAFISHKKDCAYMIFRVDGGDEACDALEAAGIRTVSKEELFGN